MIFLVLSILCSVTVGVLLKFAKRYLIDVKQAITWNYLAAILLSFFFFKPSFLQIGIVKEQLPLYLVIGILLPVVFVFLGLSVKQAGLARTDIAQRLSLLISLTAAFFLFNETFDRYKQGGIFLGFAAIIFIMYRRPIQYVKFAWLYLLIVFFGYGVIDVFLKTLSLVTAIPFTASLFFIFCISFMLSLSYILYLESVKKIKIQFVNLVFGIILGVFNFGNILCYLKAHQAMSNNPSIVFALMNLSVVILGTVIGTLFFKERLNKFNYAGLIMALAAIILITLSKLHAV